MLNSVKKSLLRILGLIKKEFITLLVDPSNRKVLTIPIVVQCVLFGYGASFILEHVPFVFFCQSNDETAHRIIPDAPVDFTVEQGQSTTDIALSWELPSGSWYKENSGQDFPALY